MKLFSKFIARVRLEPAKVRAKFIAFSGLIFEVSLRLFVRIYRAGMALCLHLLQLHS